MATPPMGAAMAIMVVLTLAFPLAAWIPLLLLPALPSCWVASVAVGVVEEEEEVVVDLLELENVVPADVVE